MERDCVGYLINEHSFDFNSHAHVERDHLTILFAFGKKISTHTLTWSVTETIPDVDTICTDFNSHAHVERDLNVMTEISVPSIFQLTRSRGA